MVHQGRAAADGNRRDPGFAEDILRQQRLVPTSCFPRVQPGPRQSFSAGGTVGIRNFPETGQVQKDLGQQQKEVNLCFISLGEPHQPINRFPWAALTPVCHFATQKSTLNLG